MDNHGVKISKDQFATLTAYLVKNYPEKPKPAGVIVPGDLKFR